jgi:hypothetical protein
MDLLTAFAVVSGLVVAYVGSLTTFGVWARGWVLPALIVMYVLFAEGREHRAYYVAIFGCTLFVSMSLGVFAVGRWTNLYSSGPYDAPFDGKRYAYYVGMLLVLVVIIPALLALFTSWIRKDRDRTA